MRGALTIGVADLLRNPGQSREESLDALLAELRVLGSEVPPDAPVHLDLRLEAVNEAVVVRGSVAVPWTGECRRCLAQVRETLRVPILEVFEVHATEGETQPLRGDCIDLEPVARESVLLGLPLAPLCREDCAGLCPRCGGDRNVSPCDCRLEVADPRWSALEGLRLDGLRLDDLRSDDTPGEVDAPGEDGPGDE